MKNHILYFGFTLLLMLSCNMKPDPTELSHQRIEEIMKEGKGHIMVFGKLENLEKMDSLSYDTYWRTLAKKSAGIEYDARSAYVLSESCIKKPREYEINSAEYDSARYDSVHFSELRKKIRFMVDSTNYDEITYLDILIQNEQLTRISKEVESLCKDKK